jgi:hypothetical protein
VVIDTAFDFWQSCPRGGDPDQRCHALRLCHQIVWGRALPNGRSISLVDRHPDGYLELQFDGLALKLTSDSVVPTYKRYKRAEAQRIREGIAPERLDQFEVISGTIGAITLFPGYRVGTANTLNMHRGRDPYVCDRMDLTLECIRLHYLKRPNPLAKTLELYPEFFALFGDFDGYVEHFLFQDLVKGGRVATFLPLDLSRAGLPQGPAEYEMFMDRSIAFVQGRNARIAALQLSVRDDVAVIACGDRPCALS